jgi:hypothetical protein
VLAVSRDLHNEVLKDFDFTLEAGLINEFPSLAAEVNHGRGLVNMWPRTRVSLEKYRGAHFLWIEFFEGELIIRVERAALGGITQMRLNTDVLYLESYSLSCKLSDWFSTFVPQVRRLALSPYIWASESLWYKDFTGLDG